MVHIEEVNMIALTHSLQIATASRVLSIKKEVPTSLKLGILKTIIFLMWSACHQFNFLLKLLSNLNID